VHAISKGENKMGVDEEHKYGAIGLVLRRMTGA